MSFVSLTFKLLDEEQHYRPELKVCLCMIAIYFAVNMSQHDHKRVCRF